MTISVPTPASRKAASRSRTTLARAAQRHQVDELVGQRRGGLLLLARPGRGPGPPWRRPRSRSAAPGGCRSSACASPCRRCRARGPGASRCAPARRSSVTSTLTVGRDVEAVQRAPGAVRALLQSSSRNSADVLGREEASGSSRRRSRRPARCSSGRSPRGRSGSAPAPGAIISFSALPGPSGSGSSSVSPLNSRRSRASAMRTTATYSRVRCSWLAEALAVPALGDLRAGGADAAATSARSRAGRSSPRSSPSSPRVRPGIWKIAEPSLICSCRPRARRARWRRRSRRPRRPTRSRSRAARPPGRSPAARPRPMPRPQ